MKKVNLQISLWFIAISCVLIVSCSKEENEPQLILSPESEMLFTSGNSVLFLSVPLHLILILPVSLWIVVGRQHNFSVS